jgi:hypothetical protein
LQQLPLALQRVCENPGSPHDVHWLFEHLMFEPGQSVSTWHGQCAYAPFRQKPFGSAGPQTSTGGPPSAHTMQVTKSFPPLHPAQLAAHALPHVTLLHAAGPPSVEASPPDEPPPELAPEDPPDEPELAPED